MSKIDQREYLKKYLSGEKIKKNSKKKKPNTEEKSRIKIIDDDIDVIKKHNEYDDLILTGEDAPQIVGIIDDRPPELRTIEDFRGSEKWKTLSSNTKDNKGEKTLQELIRKESKNNGVKMEDRVIRDSSKGVDDKVKNTVNFLSDNNFSPKRKNRRSSNDDFSPRRKSRRSSDDDFSPKRKNERNNDDFSPKRKSRRNSDDDFSSKSKSRRSNNDFSPKRKNRKNSDADRKDNKRQSSRDYSPPKRQIKVEHDSDVSPQRKRKPESARRQKSRDSNSDYSPPRRSVNLEDSRIRPKIGNFQNSKNSKSRDHSSDYSPPRKSRRAEDARSKPRGDSSSPPRKQQNRNEKVETSKEKFRDDNPDYSPPRKSDFSGSSRNYSPSRRNKIYNTSVQKEKQKPDQTLDGKKAGLQDATTLKKETEFFRKKENEIFKKMSADSSGKNAEIGVRNSRRKTTAEIQREQEREREKSKREQEKQEIYSRWGKGLKQIEDYQNKIADEMHEVSKPLARYSNDADLDEMLKKQERIGDPMLEYIREKNKDVKKNSKIPVMPIYKGSFPENRFNIRPGYRWDGVDRSNGYEKKWFDIQNQKKAIQEEAYKYSTEDM